MWPDRVSNPGPLTYESGALPTALRGPAGLTEQRLFELCYWLQLLCNIGYGTCVFKFLYIPIESKHLQ